MKAEQEKDFKDDSVVYVNPLPLVFGGADYEDLPTDKQACLYLILFMIKNVLIIIIIIGGYVAISK